MPIEIGELVINARVVAHDSRETTENNSLPPPQNNSEIIEQCVAQVLRILEDRQER